MTSGTCRLCLTPGNLADSHIIPNAYFRKMKKQRSGRLVSFDTLQNSRVKLTNESWHEPMLCKSCESKFSKLETKCIHSLRKTASKIEENSRYGSLLYAYDYSALDAFLVSILWRAAASSQEPFSSIILHPELYEEIRARLFLEVTPTHSMVRCQIFKITDGRGRILTTSFEGIAVSPIATVIGNTTIFRFVFAGYLVVFYIPSIPLKRRAELGIVKNASFLFIPTKNMQNIPELMNLLAIGYGKAASGKSNV